MSTSKQATSNDRSASICFSTHDPFRFRSRFSALANICCCRLQYCAARLFTTIFSNCIVSGRPELVVSSSSSSFFANMSRLLQPSGAVYRLATTSSTLNCRTMIERFLRNAFKSNPTVSERMRANVSFCTALAANALSLGNSYGFTSTTFSTSTPTLGHVLKSDRSTRSK